MGVHPEQYISVTLEPVSAEFSPGQVVRIRATLTNRSDTVVPLGTWGLVNPNLAMRIRLQLPDDEQSFPLPPLRWVAPRYLQPGQSLSAEVRIDAGPAGLAILARPFDRIEIEVSGILDPVTEGQALASSLPTVTIAPARMVRTTVSAESAERYHQFLTVLVSDLRNGSPKRTLPACRATVSLLLAAQRAKSNDATLPATLGDIRELELLSMLKFCLQQSPWVAKTETLGTMQSLDITDQILAIVQPCLTNPEAIVRARAAELLGRMDRTRFATVLAAMAAKDLDPRVRAVAASFAPPPNQKSGSTHE
jgi:hypothetical protein